MTIEETEKQINENARKMAEIISKGNSAEVHPSKDGVKILEVKKKVV